MTNLITSKTTNTTLSDLPLDVSNLIFSMLDVPSVCRLYVAFSKSDYAEEIAQYLTKCKVEVTAETVITGDHRRIDFDTLAKLPPCDIVVNMSYDYTLITLEYLKHLSYRSVALSIKNCGRTRAKYPLPNLNFLGTKLTELSLDGVEFEPGNIPTSITKLTLCNIRQERWPDGNSVHSLEEFTNLKHYCNIRSPIRDGMFLPQSITTIDFSQMQGHALNARTLTNLKHFTMGDKYDDHTIIPWSQLEVAHMVSISRAPAMDNMKEISIRSKKRVDNYSFKDVHCPNLKSVEYVLSLDWQRDERISTDDRRTQDITELFTNAQLGRLTSLKGYFLAFSSVKTLSLLRCMTVLHINLTDTLTESYPLPPSLTELTVWSTAPVEGIPPQLEVFACYFDKWHDVVVKSANIKRLTVGDPAGILTINCPRLTDLHMHDYSELNDIHAPNLTTLKIGSSRNAFPFNKGFSRLQHVHLTEVYYDVIIQQHLSSIELHESGPERVAISADVVTVDFVELPENTKITAKVLKCNSEIESVHDITCQELIYDGHGSIPVMVEKLTMEEFLHDVRVEEMELNKCKKLKYLSLKDVKVGELQVPPSVRQLRVVYSRQYWRPFIATQNRLECAHVFGLVNDVEIHQWPASVYVERGMFDYQPERLKRH